MTDNKNNSKNNISCFAAIAISILFGFVCSAIQGAFHGLYAVLIKIPWWGNLLIVVSVIIVIMQIQKNN